MNVSDLLSQGYCSAVCLLAMVPEGRCSCRCKGRGHGLLADTDVEFDQTGLERQSPAVMRSAPVFDCAACGKRIATAESGHNLTDHRQVVCSKCCGTRQVHTRLWPDCLHAWHDPYDHLTTVAASRAGIAWSLGVWGRDTPTDDPSSQVVVT